jgi:hypothetical protein
MSVIESAKSAIENSDSEALIAILERLNKSEIQDIATLFDAESVKIHMSGTWVERIKVNLIDSAGNLALSGVNLDRSYKGSIEQFFDASNLHSAALIALDVNVTSDFDEDYFSPDEMLFGEEYGLEASSAYCTAECKSEDRHINYGDIEDEDFDADDCEVDDDESESKLLRASISVNKIDVIFRCDSSISFKINDQTNCSTLWYIFSVLFMSSGKSVEDLSGNETIIRDFMESNFDISV